MITKPNGRCTYHCHTHWSDGSNSPAQMVARAAELGFEEIGFSDHLVIHPARIDIAWSMDPLHLDDYVREVREAAEGAEIPVRLGLEVDFFPNNARQAELDELLGRHTFDYLIGSVHMIGELSLDSSADDWEALSESEVDALFIRYWQHIKQLALTPGFDILGHLDLPKKFGYAPSLDIRGVVSLALDAVAGSRKAIELNTAGWNKPCAECYPGAPLLRHCLLRDIPVVVNDDAHAIDQLGQQYGRALELLASLHG